MLTARLGWPPKSRRSRPACRAHFAELGTTREVVMGSLDDLHGLRNGITKLEAEIGELGRILRHTQATSPGSLAISKITAEMQRFEAVRRGLLQKYSLQQAHVWLDFHDSFMDFAREEQSRSDVITNGNALWRMERVLRAYCDYKNYPESIAGDEEIAHSYRELMGVILNPEDLARVKAKLLESKAAQTNRGLNSPETGRWIISDGISENFRERVRNCLAKAGVVLGCPNGTDPEDFWLHRLYLDLFEHHSELLFSATKESGMILSVCAASSTFCSRLDRKGVVPSDQHKGDAVKKLEAYDAEIVFKYPESVSGSLEKPLQAANDSPSLITKRQNRKARGLSHFTRAVRSALIHAPRANGLEISRAVDDDVGPSPVMKAEKILLYEEAYKKGIGDLDSRYAKIRKMMRKQGVLD